VENYTNCRCASVQSGGLCLGSVDESAAADMGMLRCLGILQPRGSKASRQVGRTEGRIL